jgi:hypothetical protein
VRLALRHPGTLKAPRAYWLRHKDDGLGPNPIDVMADTKICRSDRDLAYVLATYELDSR